MVLSRTQSATQLIADAVQSFGGLFSRTHCAQLLEEGLGIPGIDAKQIGIKAGKAAAKSGHIKLIPDVHGYSPSKRDGLTHLCRFRRMDGEDLNPEVHSQICRILHDVGERVGELKLAPRNVFARSDFDLTNKRGRVAESYYLALTSLYLLLRGVPGIEELRLQADESAKHGNLYYATYRLDGTNHRAIVEGVRAYAAFEAARIVKLHTRVCYERNSVLDIFLPTEPLKELASNVGFASAHELPLPRVTAAPNVANKGRSS